MPNKNFSFNFSSFHDYDIRGIYPTDIDENFFYHLGKALVLYVGTGKKIGVGHDARVSSPSLSKSLIEGITDYGCDVIDLGQISTEIHYYASGKYGFDANIIVSASHNPGEYNGAKIVLKDVIPLHGKFGLPEIKEYMTKETLKADRKGTVETKNILDEYVQYCLSMVDVTKMKPLKVVVDAGNGMGGPVWEKVQEFIPVEIVPLYLNPDGNFPNHLPDPLKGENMNALLAKVKESRADLGIAIDGDADRIFFCDEKGEKLSSTIALAMFINHFQKQGKKGVFLYNVNVGKIVPETIKKNGSTPVRTRVGHSFIKEQMKELDGIFGGEHSGHFYMKENWNAESPLMYGLMMIQILSESGKKMSELRQEYEIYSQSGEINFKSDDKLKIINQLKDHFKDQVISMDEIDGFTFWFKDWWFIVRLSNTEPLLRLNMEADNDEILRKMLNEVIEVITSNGGEQN